MATSYTSLLGLALPTTGELQGTWGATVNDSITSLLDTAVAGTTILNTDADVTLTSTTGSANQARQAIILWTANGSVTRNITAPAQSKAYVVINNSAGTQSIVIRGVGPTTGVTIVKGERALVAWNGSDFVKVSTAGVALPIADGGTAATTAQGAINNLAGATTSGQYLRGNGTNVVMSAIQAGDVPTLNQNTTGTASNVTGVVAAANGGTGQSSYAVGDLLYASAATTISKLADVATGNALISGGVGVAPSWGKVGLTTHISGTLAIANGGTGATTAQGGINALAGATTSGQYLRGNGTNVVMSAIQAADVPTLNQNTTGTASNVTGTVAIANGGTGGTTSATARANLDVPTRTGGDASGTWGINITGSAGSASSATTATTATNWGAYGGVPSAGTSFATANTIGRSDANGYTYFGYINSSTTNSETVSVNQIIVTNGVDNFYRKSSLANLTTAVQGAASGTWSISITGSASSASTASTASTANALATGNSYQVNSLGVGTPASGTAGEIRATNNVTAYYSDDRLKTRLGGIKDALAKVRTLSGFYYEANEVAQQLGYEPVREVGVSAQQVQAVLPEVVAPAPIDDKYLTVRYEKLAPLLIEAIKELADRIDALEKGR